MPEHFPGVNQKIQEYALRILNGENPDDVLEGADAFRPGVEAAVAEYREKKGKELEKQDNQIFLETIQNPVLSEENIKKRQEEDNEKIEALRAELTKSDPFVHKEVFEGAGEDYAQGVHIYNTFMNIGKGISEGLKESFDPKVQQYVNEIRSGKSKEYVLGGAQKSLVEAVEKELAKDDIEQFEEQAGLEKVHGLESIKNMFNEIVGEYYFFTHQTDEETAESIYNSNFEVSPGTGISSTMTPSSVDALINQIERQIQGDSHRGYKGMFIVAVPRAILDAQQIRNKADAFESLLLESPDYGKNGNSNLIVPNEYNLGYLQGEDFYYNKELVKKK
jgi:hypothetical protein